MDLLDDTARPVRSFLGRPGTKAARRWHRRGGRGEHTLSCPSSLPRPHSLPRRPCLHARLHRRLRPRPFHLYLVALARAPISTATREERGDGPTVAREERGAGSAVGARGAKRGERGARAAVATREERRGEMGRQWLERRGELGRRRLHGDKGGKKSSKLASQLELGPLTS